MMIWKEIQTKNQIEADPVSPSSMLREHCSGTISFRDFGQLGRSIQPRITKSSTKLMCWSEHRHHTDNSYYRQEKEK